MRFNTVWQQALSNHDWAANHSVRKRIVQNKLAVPDCWLAIASSATTRPRRSRWWWPLDRHQEHHPRRQEQSNFHI